MEAPTTSDSAQHVPIGKWLPWLNSLSDIPHLEPLWTTIKPQVYTPADHLEENTREVALAWAMLLSRAAKEYDLNLVSCEMSVIADQRRQASGDQLFFTSYITIFSGLAESLHNAYREGFDRGFDPANPQTDQFRYNYPIVIHPQLFELGTGFFYKTFSGPPSELDLPVSPSPVLYAYGYPLVGRIGVGAAKQVPEQLDDFVSIFQQTAAAKGAGAELSGATLALVPFVRPQYTPSGKLPLEEPLPATPGGCIFFVFRERVPPQSPQLRGFLRSVRWVLAEASAKESQNAYDASAQRQELTAGMLHGTVTALRSIRAFSIRNMLLRASADRHEFGINDLIVEIKGDPQKVARHKSAIVKQLKRMVAAEDIATSLTGLAQIRADKTVRVKHQSTNPVSLRELIRKAWLVAHRTDDRRFTLTQGPHDDREHDWVLPSGYVSENLLLGVLMELFRNAIEHSGKILQREIEVQVSIFGTKDEAVVRIQNQRANSEEGTAPRGFITQAKMLFDDVDGLGLTTSAPTGDQVFLAELSLGAITSELDRRNNVDAPTDRLLAPEQVEIVQ